MFQKRLKQTLWQGPALIIMAGLIAIGINHWRGNGIPLVGDWSVETRFSDDSGNRLVIGLDEAERSFWQETAADKSGNVYALKPMRLTDP